jgi:diguanylate cyclase (GGDEF)-like protein/PAS domain S-box-containing protein
MAINHPIVAAYDVILFLAVFPAAIWMVYLVWRWRQAPGSRALLIMMVGMGLWSLFYALHLSDFIRPFETFWARLMFIGVVCVPGAFFIWACRFSQHDRWINQWTLALLFIEPLLLNICVWTDPMHGWFTGGHPSGKNQPFIGGIGFWLHSAYSYLLLLTGGVFLFLHWLRAQPAYRKQAFWAMLALPAATIFNVITILHFIPGVYVDFSPIGFILCGAVLTYAQARHKIFEILPIARTNVVEGMLDGVVVLDTQERIIDMNPSAQSMLGINLKSVLGLPAPTILPFWRKTDGGSDEFGDIGHEFTLELYGLRNIDLHMTVIKNQRQRTIGKLMVMRDITKIKQIEAALRESNENLLQKLSEIESLQARLKEQAIRDPLTGLYNRRFLEESLQRELAQAKRSGSSLSIAMIDLDHFKTINDSYGHATGDRLLSRLGQLLLTDTRSGDVACRFGGEEFVLVMPGVPPEIAAKRLDQLREAFASLKFSHGSGEFSMSFSAGIASFPRHGSDYGTLINAADRALYTAKASGRNIVITSSPVSGETIGGGSDEPFETQQTTKKK